MLKFVENIYYFAIKDVGLSEYPVQVSVRIAWRAWNLSTVVRFPEQAAVDGLFTFESARIYELHQVTSR